MDYKTAGVDIEAGYKSVELMKEHVKRTMREEVLGGLGGFSGAFSLAKIKEMEEPVLLSGQLWPNARNANEPTEHGAFLFGFKAVQRHNILRKRNVKMSVKLMRRACFQAFKRLA